MVFSFNDLQVIVRYTTSADATFGDEPLISRTLEEAIAILPSAGSNHAESEGQQKQRHGDGVKLPDQPTQ